MKVKQFVWAAMGMLFMASCSNELPVSNTDDSVFGTVPEGMVEFRFKLSGITPTTSYATVALEESEMKIDSMTVIVAGVNVADQANAPIYGVYPAVTQNGYSSIAIPNDDLTAIADGEKVRFVMIANHLWTNLWDATTKKYIITTASKYADVEKLIAMWTPESQFPKDDPTFVKPIGLPMYAIIDQERPKINDVLKISTAKLKRPVARFDVKNWTENSLTITKLGLANVRNVANAVGGALPGEADGLQMLTVADWTNGIPDALNVFDQETNLASIVVPGLFYLAPGEDTDNLKLLVEGDLLTSSGVEKVSYVLSLAKDDVNLAIQPNTRYRITLRRVNGDIYGDISFGQDGWGEGSGGGTDDNDYEYPFK